MPPVTTTTTILELYAAASLPYQTPPSSSQLFNSANINNINSAPPSSSSLAPATSFNSSNVPSPLSRIIAIGIACVGALVVSLGALVVLSTYIRKRRRQQHGGGWDSLNAGATGGNKHAGVGVGVGGDNGEPMRSKVDTKTAPRLKPLSFLQGREGPKEWVPGTKSKPIRRNNTSKSHAGSSSLRKSLLSALSRKSTMLLGRSGTLKSSSVGHHNDISTRDSPSMERLDPAGVNAQRSHHHHQDQHGVMNVSASRRPTQATVESFEMTQRPLSIPVSSSFLNLTVPTTPQQPTRPLQTQTHKTHVHARNGSTASLGASTSAFKTPEIERPPAVHGPSPISPSVPSPSVYSQSHEGDPGRVSPTATRRVVGVSKRPSLTPIPASSSSLSVPRAGSPSRQALPPVPSSSSHAASSSSSDVQWRTDIWSTPSHTAPTTMTSTNVNASSLTQTRRPSATNVANTPSSFARYSRMGSMVSAEGSTELPYRTDEGQQRRIDRTPAATSAAAAVSTARRPSNSSISGFTATRRPSSASYKNHQWI